MSADRSAYFQEYYRKTRPRRLQSRKDSWLRTGRPPKEIRYLREMQMEAQRCGI